MSSELHWFFFVVLKHIVPQPVAVRLLRELFRAIVRDERAVLSKLGQHVRLTTGEGSVSVPEE